MRADGFIATYGWMLDLGLTLAERTVYGLIHGITFDGVHTFHGSMEYIGEWCGISARSVRRILGRLVEQGLIIREDHIGQASDFWVNPDFLPITPAKLSAPDKLATPPRPTCPPTPAKLSANNNSFKNTDKNNSVFPPRTREDDGKILFGVKVRMTPAEHAKLVADYGEQDAAAMIQMLDDYLVEHPRKHYASDYRAARNWPAQRLAEQRTAEQRLKNAQEAGQRAATPQQPYSGYGEYGLAASKRLEELLKQN